MRPYSIILTTIAAIVLATSANAAVTEYTNKLQWEIAAGAFTTITFAELPVNTLITTQYAHLGVTFADNSDYTDFNKGYLNDNFGLNGAFDSTSLGFSQPMYTIAVDYPGSVDFLLFFQNELIYTSSHFHIPGGLGGFAGLVSDTPFDSVLITDIEGDFFIDDLHFGPPIPAPSAAVSMVIAVAALRSRRRK